jgi:hypothetical protein
MGRAIGKREKLELKGKVVNLVGQGLAMLTIEDRLGISRNTIANWAKVDDRFKRALDTARERYSKGQIEGKLWQLANGYQEEELVEEFMGVKVVKGEEVPCKYTRKVKVRAPSEKALMALASKYAPKEYKEDSETNINVRITQRDRSLTTAERLKLLEQEGSEVIEVNDYRELTTETKGD